MAFASTKTGENIVGNLRMIYGTYTQVSGDTGGDISTGLAQVKTFHATAATKQSTSTGTVTITTADPAADVTGYWLALGW